MTHLIRRTAPQPPLPPFPWDPFWRWGNRMSWDPFVAGPFVPRFERTETKHAYLFKADLPGADPTDLEISLTGNRLSISSKHAAAQRIANGTYEAYVRSYRSFSRSFTLPEEAHLERCTAELRNGVLTVSLPKTSSSQPAKKSPLAAIGDKLKRLFKGEKRNSHTTL